MRIQKIQNQCNSELKKLFLYEFDLHYAKNENIFLNLYYKSN